GGSQSGAVGQRNTYEKHVALQFAKTIQSKLEQKGYKVYLTRNNDTRIELTDRRVKAHKVNADAFVSIHANDIENNSKVRGSSVLIWSLNADSKRAERLAESENGQEKNVDISGVAEHIENKNARQIYTSMQDEYNSAESARLGNNILKRIAKHNIVLNKNKTVDLADLAVLRSLDMPSVLIELAFLSNLEDEKLLNSSTFREKMSDSIANGIDAYFKDPKTILK
ncbi:MAG: N-acetylmuramoyl-L-alanine amidase, partial [Neisseriaceae bacterium]|nr:N-acetylmuramoyl-L-alanine amidase [Neisseriaceae bacterium]